MGMDTKKKLNLMVEAMRKEVIPVFPRIQVVPRSQTCSSPQFHLPKRLHRGQNRLDGTETQDQVHRRYQSRHLFECFEKKEPQRQEMIRFCWRKKANNRDSMIEKMKANLKLPQRGEWLRGRPTRCHLNQHRCRRRDPHNACKSLYWS